MATRSTNPLQPPREERRRLLSRSFLEIVEGLLEEGESYSDISVERLIKAVNIARSSFYVYFDDKGDLLQAMAEDVTADMAKAGAAWFEFSVDGSQDDLREALRTLFDAYRRHRTILGAIVEFAASDQRARAQHVRLVETAVAGLADHIASHQRQGAAAPEIDAHRSAQWLVWMFERGLYQLVSPAPASDVDDLLDTVTAIAWRTLYAGHRD